MSDNFFLGQIQIFGFGYPPAGWAQCAGQLVPISQNSALFSLLGTSFGGDGKTTFGLPNFQGSTACGVGQGPGLTPRNVGDAFGTESVTLLPTEIPLHTHGFNIYNQGDATKRHGTPIAGDALSAPGTLTPFATGSTPPGVFPPQMVQPTGGSQPHENRQPYLAMNFCVALAGAFPARP